MFTNLGTNRKSKSTMMNLSENKEYLQHKKNIEALNVSKEEKKRLKFECWLLHIGNINTINI